MVILITGITSGFGRAMAKRLAADGHKVYGTHRKDVEHIPGVSYIKVEATDDAQVEAAVKQVIDDEGRIDIFINNAGMGIGGPLEFSSLEDARRQMDVNWMGMVRFLHFVLPQTRAQKSGMIICFSSIGGLIGLPYQGLYSASKYAIEGYCEALRLEVKNFGINVVVIEPGDFSTNFTAQRKCVSGTDAAAAYPSYERSLKGIEKDERTGLKPDFLADKISKIVRKKSPRYNYIIASPLQKLSVIAKAILPRRLFYWILSKYYNL
ncbi:MAG TPA: oxidoreductase [Rikenellaceae bacterium]|nr:oxidoreductase [Rikenellaceae bacterium]